MFNAHRDLGKSHHRWASAPIARNRNLNGWKNPVAYADKISGARTSRPELNRLLQDIRGGRVRRLVVYKLDRLGRSLTHLALILDEINRLKVPLIASSQGIFNSACYGSRGIRAWDNPGAGQRRPCRRYETRCQAGATGDIKGVIQIRR